jgi:NADPH-dependent ferric siderophore reductase
MRVFTGTVVEVSDLAPGMRRVVLGGGGLAGYGTTGVGDEYVRLVLPAAGATAPLLPAVAGDDLDYSSIDLATMRTYTVRAFEPDPARVTIDVVLHDGGVAAGWARAARPGDLVGINTPGAIYDPPPGLEWQVLVADRAGLPAASRLLGSAPPGVRTRAVLEVPGPGHRPPLDVPPGVEITWVYGGNGHGPSRLEDVVRALPRPGGAGYVWVAGETRVLRGVRKYLRRELGLPATAYKALGYWTDRAEAWTARYEALDPATKAALEAVWDEDAEPEDLELRYDDRLASLGL